MRTNHSLAHELSREGFLRLHQIVPALLPFSAATLWRKVKAGSFPAPVKLSERVTAWRTQDVQEWMQTFGSDDPTAIVGKAKP